MSTTRFDKPPSNYQPAESPKTMGATSFIEHCMLPWQELVIYAETLVTCEDIEQVINSTLALADLTKSRLKCHTFCVRLLNVKYRTNPSLPKYPSKHD